MNKKGLSQIDWVISFGVFVVFLLLLFIWFGPSLSSEYSEEYLGEIASKGFKDASYHEVFRYPVFVEIDSSFPPGGGIGIGPRIPNELSSEPIERFSVIDEAGNLIDERKIEGDHLYFSRDALGLTYDTIVLMYYSEYFDVSALSVSSPGGLSSRYNITLGIGERLYGFSERRFNDLILLDYKDFKEALKYPLNKNIGVFVYDSVGFTNLLYDYNVSQPTEDDNVYVVSWSDVLINENGSVEPITVLVKTW